MITPPTSTGTVCLRSTDITNYLVQFAVRPAVGRGSANLFDAVHRTKLEVAGEPNATRWRERAAHPTGWTPPLEG